MMKARCAGDVVDLTAIVNAKHPDYQEGRRICSACPLAVQCLSAELAVMRADIPTYGMFAGTLPSERRRMLRREVSAAAAIAAADTEVDPVVAAELEQAVNAHPSNHIPAKRANVTGRKPIKHGSASGAQAHRRRGEKPCDECADAWRKKVAEGQRERRARLKSAAAASDLAAAA